MSLRYVEGMTKTDLIERISTTTGRTKREAEETIEIVLTAISEALAQGDKVDLRGFGSFQINERAERQGRNPKTGEAIAIAARKVAVFKPGKELAERVNGVPASGDTATEKDRGLAVPSPESAKVHGDKIT